MMVWSRVQRLLAVNIVVDAFGTAAFLAGIGFFTLQLLDLYPAAVLSAVSAGGLAGVALSFPVTSLSDLVGARRVLLYVQVAQTLVFTSMFLLRIPSFVLAMCAVGAALSRITSPVRGTLPTQYMTRQQLLGFKAAVKTATVVATIAGAAIAAWLGTVASEEALLAVPLLNGASFVVALTATMQLPRAVDRPQAPSRRATSQRVALYRPDVRILAAAAALGLFACLGYVPDVAIALLAASEIGVPDWIVGASPAIALAAAIGGQRVLRGRSTELATIAPLVLTAALLAEAISLASVALVTYDVFVLHKLVVVGLLGAAIVLAELALIAVVYVLWDLQYSMGDDRNRGAIVSVFSVGNSAGIALSPAVASGLYFRGGAVGIATAVGIASLAAAALKSFSGQSRHLPLRWRRPFTDRRSWGRSADARARNRSPGPE